MVKTSLIYHQVMPSYLPWLPWLTQMFVERLVSYSRGLYYKTLRTHNIRQVDRFRSKLVYFILSATSSLLLTNILAYYGIRSFRIHNVFIAQAPDLNKNDVIQGGGAVQLCKNDVTWWHYNSTGVPPDQKSKQS